MADVFWAIIAGFAVLAFLLYSIDTTLSNISEATRDIRTTLNDLKFDLDFIKQDVANIRRESH